MSKEKSPTPNPTADTLIDWRLTNSDKPFDDQEFLDGLEESAKKSSELFDRAFSGQDKI